MELANGAEDNHGGVDLGDLAGFFVDRLGGEVFKFFGGVVFGGGQEAARVAPESAAAGEAFGNCLLALFVKVLAEVAGGAHIPGHEVRAFQFGVVLPSGLTGVEVKSEVFGAVWFGNVVPRFGQLPLKAAHVVGETQPHVEVRNAASLELQHPQVMHAGEPATKAGKPRVEVFLDGAPVGGRFVVGKTELRYKRLGGVAGQEPKATAGVIGKALNLGALWWRGIRTLSVPGPYNLHRLGIDKEGFGERTALRYAAINKRPVHAPHHPGRAGAEGRLFHVT